jgi:hypothetical protein
MRVVCSASACDLGRFGVLGWRRGVRFSPSVSPSTRGTSRRWGPLPNRAPGWSDHGGVRVARRDPLAQRRGCGATAVTVRHGRHREVVRRPRHHRSSVSVTRIIGLVSKGLVRSAAEGAAVVESPTRRLAGAPKRVVPSPPSVGPRAHSHSPVLRSVPGERLTHCTCPGSGSPPLASPRAASRGVSNVGRVSRAFRQRRAPSTGCPTREWSRRARPSCANMSPKRAAHSQR